MTVHDELLDGPRAEPIPLGASVEDGVAWADLRIEIELLGDAMLIMEVAGEVDCLTQPALEAALGSLDLCRADTLILDLRGIEFLSARGASALAAAAHRAVRHDVELRVLPSPTVSRMTALLGLNPRFLPVR
jgi:anti-anti-sigma factor